MRRLVLGDLHGAYKALLQVFERSEFDYDKDILFVIGDVVDGWTETRQCIDELLKVKNLIFIIGNHDIWAWDWMEGGHMPKIWLTQGGKETIQSYGLSWYGERIKPKVPLFIGHTETTSYSTDPVKFCEVWNIDQGAGFKGKLTLMDIDTKEFWTSDQVETLYKEVI